MHFIQLLRLRHQHLEGEPGRQGDNLIDPEQFNELDRRILEESFRQARKPQAPPPSSTIRWAEPCWNLKKLLFGRGSAPGQLADDVRGALEAWRSCRPRPGRPHFHSPSIISVVDVSVAGLDAEVDALLGIAAVAVVRRGGRTRRRRG